MKFFSFLIFSLMMTLTSIVSERQHVIDFIFDDNTTLEKVASFNTDPLQTTAPKHSEKQNHIAQGFIPVVILADCTSHCSDFQHYIPLYSLVRVKEYFLLI